MESKYQKLWSNWKSKAVLNEIQDQELVNNVVKTSEKIKRKAGLDALNQKFTELAAFNDIFGDKLRIIKELEENRVIKLAAYLTMLRLEVTQSYNERVAKGFIEEDFSVVFQSDETTVMETRTRLQEDGGGEYEEPVKYYQLSLNTYFTVKASTKENSNNRRIDSLSIGRGFNKYKMKEASDFWASIQSYVTKDRKFISDCIDKADQYYENPDIDLKYVLSKTKSENVIVYSRAPVDVLRMSDFDGIYSCHSEGNSYFQCAITEAVRGGAIAFLVNRNDIEKIEQEGRLQDIEIFADKARGIQGPQPTTRLRLRRIFNLDTKQEFATSERRVYGKIDSSFRDSVESWIAEVQKGKFVNPENGAFQVPEGDYVRVGGSYGDTTPVDTFILLSKSVAKLNGKQLTDEETRRISNLNFASIAVNEGADFITPCATSARDILNHILHLIGSGNMITIGSGDPDEIRVRCKTEDGKDIQEFSYNSEGVEYPEFDSIVVPFKLQVSLPNVDLNVEEFSNKEFMDIIQTIEADVGERNVLVAANDKLGFNKTNTMLVPLTKGSKHFNTSVSSKITFNNVEESRNLKKYFETIDSHSNTNSKIIKKACFTLGLANQNPLDSYYGKSIINQIKEMGSRFLYAEPENYGTIEVKLRAEHEGQSGLVNQNQQKLNLVRPSKGYPSSTSLKDYGAFTRDMYFYNYKIPKEIVSKMLNTVDSPVPTDSQVTKISNYLNEDIRYKVINKVANEFPAIRHYFQISASRPQFLGRKIEKGYDLFAIAKVVFSSNMSVDDERTNLKFLEYLIDNYDEFLERIDTIVVDTIKQHPQLSKLLEKAQFLNIEDKELSAETAAVLKPTDTPQFVEMFTQKIRNLLKNRWFKQDYPLQPGNYVNTKPFYAANIPSTNIIKIYSVSGESTARDNPFDFPYYHDFAVSILGANNPIVFSSHTGGRYSVSNNSDSIDYLTTQLLNDVDDRSSFRYTYGKATKYETEKAYVDPKDYEEFKQFSLYGMPEDTPFTDEPEKPREPQQLSMFERRLLKERLIKWYKKNKR